MTMMKAETLIGRITQGHESAMTAVLDQRETEGFPLINAGGVNIAVGQIGTYVMVKQRGFEVAMVTG